ncbi:unnamed protein product [Amaranthus hypochondriacus]
MDFNLKQWRDEQHESEDEQQQQQPSAKIPRQLILDSPQHHHHHQQQISALPLFVSAEQSQPSKVTTHLSSFLDHSSTPTAVPTSTPTFPRVGGRYSFSIAQWQELELQALIYRHMVAGASVPPELLQLVKKSLITSSAASYYLHQYSPHFQPTAAWLQAGYWGKGSMDPEPGRCRRTDGKKWRCSRDVVAGHKYCERHMHRGRNRSRKPVEFPAASVSVAVSADNSLVSSSLNKPSSFVSDTVAADTHFSLSRSGASSLDAFQLNPGSSDRKTLFGLQHESSASGDGGKSSNSNKVLMHLFDDWPRSENVNGSTLPSSTSLSMSTPGNSSSDFLRLSTGNGEELGRTDGNAGTERGHQQLSWNAGGWGANQVSSMGGPLAEALRSSSNSSPTSVLHQLRRCSAPDTNFVSV